MCQVCNTCDCSGQHCSHCKVIYIVTNNNGEVIHVSNKKLRAMKVLGNLTTHKIFLEDDLYE